MYRVFDFSIGFIDFRVSLRWENTHTFSKVNKTLLNDIIAFFNGGEYSPLGNCYLFPTERSLLQFGFLAGLTDHRDYIWYSGKAFDDPNLSFWYDDNDDDEYFFDDCNDDNMDDDY